VTTTAPAASVRALADRFGALLLRDLGAETLRRVRAENRRRRAGGDFVTCATHDELDSNMTMAEAFASVVGREDSAESLADAALWNGAWAAWDAESEGDR
jgi:hypothetical protein